MTEQLNRRGRPLARGVRRALLGPVNMTVAGAAAVGAAVVGSPALALLGAAAYAAMVAWDLSTPAFWRKVVGSDDAAAFQELEPRKVFDAETRAALERVHAARGAIRAAAAAVDGSAREALAGVMGTLEEIDGRVARLVARSDELSRYLAGIDEGALRAELGQLGERARTDPDEEARQHYAEARAAREEQLKTVGDIVSARARLVANLAQIVATLEGIPPRLIKMRVLDAQAADDVSGDVGRELADVNVELGAFEETLESLVGANP